MRISNKISVQFSQVWEIGNKNLDMSISPSSFLQSHGGHPKTSRPRKNQKESRRSPGDPRTPRQLRGHRFPGTKKTASGFPASIWWLSLALVAPAGMVWYGSVGSSVASGVESKLETWETCWGSSWLFLAPPGSSPGFYRLLPWLLPAPPVSSWRPGV